MKQPSPVAQVPKLDAAELVQLLANHTGIDLDFLGTAVSGEVGAAFVRWPDGHEGVLTRSWQDRVAIEQTASILEIARSAGIPSPRYELIHPLSDGSVILQERLAGVAPQLVDDNLIHEMLAIVDRCAHLLAGRHDVPGTELYLNRSGPGFCLHETLARHDRRTRRLLQWVHEVGNQSPASMTGDDLVHTDFHPGNVLVNDAGHLAGVVDWDGASRGDRRIALVTLAFDLSWGVRFSDRYGAVSPSAIARVSEILDAMDQESLRAFWAHMSLRLVDWSIRHHPTAVVDHYLAFATSRFDLG